MKITLLDNRIWISTLVLVIVIGLLGGCGFFKTGSKSDKEDVVKLSLDYDAEVKLSVQWSRKIGKGLGKKYVKNTPAIAADRIFVADAYGLVVALNRFNGDRIWDAQIGKPDRRRLLDLTDRSDASFVAGGVGVGRGLVLVGTVRGHLVALSITDGTEVWRQLLSGEVLAPATVASEVIIVQTGDGKMSALEVEDGATRWTFVTQPPALLLRGTASPALSPPYVISGFANGSVAAVEIASGLPVWEQRVTLPEGTTDIDRMVDVDGRPIIIERFVYAASHQGKVRAMNRESGDIIWEAAEPSFHALAHNADHIFVVRDDNEIVAIHRESGDELWRQPKLQSVTLTDPLVYEDYLVVADHKGFIHVLAQDDGRLVGSRRLGKSFRTPLVNAGDDVFYALDDAGKLQAVSITILE